MTVFELLELDNFKSYKEKAQVEWRQFSAVIGPNGAGKSCLVEAVKFVLCFSPYNSCSIEWLTTRICNQDNYDQSRTYVKITFIVHEKRTSFQRTINYDKSKIIYTIDDVECNLSEYKKQLLSYNVNPKVNNLLIEQHFVENIATMGAKERSEYFEYLSGSSAFKSEYIRLLKELKKALMEKDELKKLRNFYYKKKKDLKNINTESKNYEELLDELKKMEFDYYFAKLYKIDKTIDESTEMRSKSIQQVKIIEKLKKSTDNSIESFKKQIEENIQSLDNYEDKIKNKKEKVTEYMSKMMQISQKLSVCKDNVTKLEVNLDQAKKIDKAHKNTIKDLETQLKQVEEDKETFTRNQAEISSVQLEKERYMEYIKLKSEAQRRSAAEISKLDTIKRQRDSIKDQIEEYERKNDLLSEQIKRKQLECDNLNEKISQIEKNIQDTESTEKCKQQKCEELKDEVENLIERSKTIMVEIENLNLLINECKESVLEDRKTKRKQENLQAFQSNFKGVIDRLKNVCDIIDPRYQVAITKIMGHKNMDAIVVDTKSTAEKCIMLLKDKYRGNKFSVIEKFLPIDYVKTKSLNKAKRVVQQLSNAKLAFDVVRPKFNGIDKVLHHVLGDVIICETDEEASTQCASKQLDFVTLNGNFYHHDGIISGGLASLAQRSREWNDREKENLKIEKQTKITVLRTLQAQIREKQEILYILSSELSGLNQQLEKHLIPLLKEEKENLEKKEKELSELKSNFSTFDKNFKMKELKKIFHVKNNEYKNVHKKKDTIEDEVFKKFCARIHISNIRVYEEGDFKKSQERQDRINEYDNLLDKIINQIKYEKNRDTETTVKNLESRIKDEKETYDNLKKEKEKLEKLIDKYRNSLKEDEIKPIKKNIDSIEKKLKLEKHKRNLMEADLKEQKAIVAANDARILNLRAEKHELLMKCKMDNINIPLSNGSIEKLLLKVGIDYTATESSESSNQTTDESQLKEQNLEIDYEKLPNPVRKLNKNDLKDHVRTLKDKLHPIREKVIKTSSINNPIENLELVQKEFKTAAQKYNNKLEELRLIKKKFEDVKTDRGSKFNDFFYSVSKIIDKIFKDLFQNQSAQALITMKNSDEPYLDGIDFNCIISTKQFTSMEYLSGGEKAMCTLALLVAIHNVKPVPCIIFDEVDAALDQANRKKLYNYFSKLKSSTQIINISHRPLALIDVDAAVIVHINRINTSSPMHVDVPQYQEKYNLSSTKSSSSDKILLLRKKKSFQLC